MELCEELEALLRQARPIFCDETALADVTVKGRANFVTRCDTGVQNFLKGELERRWPDIQFLGEEGGCAAPDPSPAEETSQREEPTADEPADGAANGVLEQAGEDETPAVEQFGASGGSAVQLDAEQITSIEISSPDGDTTVTDEDGIGLIAALLSPSGQAQSWKALGEASYSVDINYAGGSARLDVYVADGSLVCITDGGGAYSAAGSPAEFLDALN